MGCGASAAATPAPSVHSSKSGNQASRPSVVEVAAGGAQTANEAYSKLPWTRPLTLWSDEVICVATCSCMHAVHRGSLDSISSWHGNVLIKQCRRCILIRPSVCQAVRVWLLTLPASLHAYLDTLTGPGGLLLHWDEAVRHRLHA